MSAKNSNTTSDYIEWDAAINVSVHFSPNPTKQADILSFSIIKKKVRLLILTFRAP